MIALFAVFIVVTYLLTQLSMGMLEKTSPKYLNHRCDTLPAYMAAHEGPPLGDMDYKCINCSVVLITIDALRADHLGCYGYSRNTSPFLDSFSKENIKFEHAISAAPWTTPSIASIYSSFYPTAHGVMTFSDPTNITETSIFHGEFITIAELLRENGYNTAGITSNALIADYLGFTQGFDVFKTFKRSQAKKNEYRSIQATQKREFHQKAIFFTYPLHGHTHAIPGPTVT